MPLAAMPTTAQVQCHNLQRSLGLAMLAVCLVYHTTSQQPYPEGPDSFRAFALAVKLQGVPIYILCRCICRTATCLGTYMNPYCTVDPEARSLLRTAACWILRPRSMKSQSGL